MAREMMRRRARRPAWMRPGGREMLGDIGLDRLLPEWPVMWGRAEEQFVPTFDFYDKEGAYHLTAELPGVNKDDLTVTVNDGTVTVSGRKEESQEQQEADFYLKESRSGSFTRQFLLPDEVDRDKIQAKFDNGVLELVMPHDEKSERSGKIEIE